MSRVTRNLRSSQICGKLFASKGGYKICYGSYVHQGKCADLPSNLACANLECERRDAPHSTGAECYLTVCAKPSCYMSKPHAAHKCDHGIYGDCLACALTRTIGHDFVSAYPANLVNSYYGKMPKSLQELVDSIDASLERLKRKQQPAADLLKNTCLDCGQLCKTVLCDSCVSRRARAEAIYNKGKLITFQMRKDAAAAILRAVDKVMDWAEGWLGG